MRQALMATGYLLVFLPIAVMVVGHELGFEWGPLILFFGVFPVVRSLTGDVEKEAPVWTEGWSKFLSSMPIVYAGGFVFFFAWVVAQLGARRPEATLDQVGFVSGVLVTFALASCVAHELVHQKTPWARRLGNLLTALGGYPFFGYEHLAHHASPRDHDKAHCPRIDESIWSFVARRMVAAPREAYGWAAASRARSRSKSFLDSIWCWIGVSVASLATMSIAGGMYGVATFLTLAVGLPLLMNMIVYLQHWGLGTDNGVGGTKSDQVGWEDACRAQAWMTLNIAHHHEHHQRSSVPYYRLGMSGDGPVAPGGYAVMLLVAMVPPLWYRLMLPRLQGWMENPELQESAGRGLYCLNINASEQPPART